MKVGKFADHISKAECEVPLSTISTQPVKQDYESQNEIDLMSRSSENFKNFTTFTSRTFGMNSNQNRYLDKVESKYIGSEHGDFFTICFHLTQLVRSNDFYVFVNTHGLSWMRNLTLQKGF